MAKGILSWHWCAHCWSIIFNGPSPPKENPASAHTARAQAPPLPSGARGGGGGGLVYGSRKNESGPILAHLLSFSTHYPPACTIPNIEPLSSKGRVNYWCLEAAPIVCPFPLPVPTPWPSLPISQPESLILYTPEIMQKSILIR